MPEPPPVFTVTLRRISDPSGTPRLPRAGDRVLIKPSKGELTIELDSISSPHRSVEFVRCADGEQLPHPCRWVSLNVYPADLLPPDGVMMIIAACTGLGYRELQPVTADTAYYELVAAP